VKLGPLIFAGLVVAFLALRFRRLGTEQRLIAIVVAAGLAVYGSGVVQLPDLEKTIKDLGEALGPYTYVLVGVMAYLETGAFVGLVAPGEFTVVLGGVIAGQGRIEVVPLIALVWVAAVAGDLTSYVLGRRLGRGFLLRHGLKVKITPERLEQVEAFFDRHGGATILVGRFLGLVRALAPFVAGASHMRLRRFLPFDIVAAGLWSATFVLLGFVFWRSFDRVIALAKQGGFALGTVVVVVAGTIALVRHFRVPEHRDAVRRGLEHERRPLFGAGARALLALESGMLRPAVALLRGPARFVRDRLTPGQLGLEVTTLLAVALVAGFTFVGLVAPIDRGRSIPSDPESLRIADEIRADAVTDAVRWVTHLGTATAVGIVVVVALAWLVRQRRMLEAAVLGVGSLLTFLAVNLFKVMVDRPRPAGGLVEAAGESFPSGHAAYAVAYVAVAVAVARNLRRSTGRALLVGAAIAVAALVGLTRVYLRVHYWSDVLAGWALAAALFSACGLVALVVGALRHNATQP
jgi:membrane protein DedA with SNARE-associated domain/membrane-associated phospholipid phosphatase